VAVYIPNLSLSTHGAKIKMPVNPYIAGNPVGGGDAFVGRADVLRDVARVLRSPSENALVLYGQRRIGKTSILQELMARLPELGPYQPVYFDLQGKAVASLREVLAQLAIPWGIPTEGDFLPQVLAHMPSETSLVILLDEYGLLDNRAGAQADESMFIYLRDLLTLNPKRLQFIFVSGQRPEDMPSLALSIFKGIKSRPVSLLSKQETFDLIRLGQKNNSLHWPTESMELVYELTGGHPFLTQQLCQEVWEQAYYDTPAEAPTIIPRNVEEAIPYAMRSSANALEWVWDGLGPAERVVASALARVGPGRATQAQFSRGLHESGVRVLIGPLQDAVHILSEWDLIDLGDSVYRFKVELLRRWIADRKSVVQMQEEVRRIEPVADSLFQEAYSHYQQSELNQAVPLLYQAIGLNPNHTQANQLLAEILLAQGDVYKARQMLESLADYQPTSLPRLVQAVLLQARETTGEEQLTLYNRVLQLDPTQPEALAGRRRILVQRGDAALDAGSPKDAMAAYRQADMPEKIVAAGLQLVERREQAGRHLAALDLAEQLYAEFPSQRQNFPALWLAEILLSRGEVALARRKLEKLYEDQPDTVRPLLARTLLLQAKTTADEDQRLELIVAVLELAPEQPEARKEFERIWAKRAHQFETAGQPDEAMAAFRRANLPEKADIIEAELRHHRFEAALQKLAQLEASENYAEALSLSKSLQKDYPEFREALPNLELLERKAYVDILYQRALTALQDDDRHRAQTLLAQVVAIQPDFREATRYLHRVVAGIDVSELVSELEEEQALLRQQEAAAQAEAALRSQLETEMAQLQQELEAERVTRRETEAFAQKEATALRQREKELQQLQNKLETEKSARHDVEAKAQREVEGYRQIQTDLERLRRQIEAEREARQKADELARQEAEGRQAQMEEIARLKELLEAERRDSLQKVKIAAVKARREVRAEVIQQQVHLVTPQKPKAPLSAWNPVHYVRLMWWLFMDLDKARDYKRQFGAPALHRVGKWPAALLIWLPLLFPTLALGLGTLPASPHAWPAELYLWFSAVLLLVCLLTGWVGDTDDIFLSMLMLVVAFLGAIGAANAVAVGLSVSVYNDWMIGLTTGLALIVAIGVAFVVQGDELKLGTVVTIGVAIVIVMVSMAIRIGYVAADIVVDIPISAAAGMAGCIASSVGIGVAVWIGENLWQMNNKWFIALFGMLIIGVPGSVAGLVAGYVANDMLVGAAFGVAFSLANAVVIGVFIVLGALLDEEGYLYRKNYTAWLARGSFGLLVVVYAIILWQFFLGGWQMILPADQQAVSRAVYMEPAGVNYGNLLPK
jgi:hypothetical protein